MPLRFRWFAALLVGLCCLGSAMAGESVNFSLKDIGGKTVELAPMLEKGPVLISFWGTFCEPCKKEIPHLIEIVDAHAEQGMQLLLVSIDSPRSQGKVRPYAMSQKWEHPVLLDANGKVMKQLKGQNPPYTLIVTAEDVIYRHSGYRPGDEKELAAFVESMFKTKADGE
ncbi:MAG: TlpA family protein disulfide reductase [Calditrichaeota bacterium]|nr:TlpA family protein disulfide reductase [Candidatus Cloacimonadota bacterium]MCA9785181.1 TlpA family protein disulfide reductase [Candidatus Cloacimonadota bacterium]MCB1045815.1 TlpA family protein disulfide reductase [Calditrichota bacterium]MCB9473842.1 TlpA family protein disulfide reductase [Candidatus Delongbacteria bacterium]